MGAQISLLFAQAGYSVFAFDINNDRLESGLSLIRKGKYGLESSIAKGRMDSQSAKRILDRIETSTSMAYTLAGADFVLEAAVEDLETKRGIVRAAAEQASPQAVIATNTSTLSISKIASNLPIEARKRVVGMHFFNPPAVMKLVEVVNSSDTDSLIAERVKKMAVELNKVPVLVKDYPGFVANRIGISVFVEASELLERKVASVRDIDIAMRLGYGYPMGPFELGDFVGLDARLRNMEALYEETGDARFKPPEILRKLVSEGYLGDPKTRQGSKGGYYEYFGLKKPSEDI